MARQEIIDKKTSLVELYQAQNPLPALCEKCEKRKDDYLKEPTRNSDIFCKSDLQTLRDYHKDLFDWVIKELLDWEKAQEAQ